MALPKFHYLRPHTLEEALAMAAAHGESAKFLAGGQTLVPLLAMRLVRPAVIIDLARLTELKYIQIAKGHLCIGALTRHREVAESPLVREVCPLLAVAASHIGHTHIRNRGTLGGSLAHADPAAEYPLAITVLEGRIQVASSEGNRSVPAEEFFLGPLSCALMSGELVTGVEIPLPGAQTGWSFREMVQRSGDFALVAVAVLLQMADGMVQRAAIGIGGGNPTPVRARRAESFLLGKAPTAEAIQEAAEVAAGEVNPSDDIHASAAYRRSIVRVYVRYALLEAAGRVEA